MVAVMYSLPPVGQFDAHTFYDFCEETYNKLAECALNVGFHIEHLDMRSLRPHPPPAVVDRIVAEALARREKKPT